MAEKSSTQVRRISLSRTKILSPHVVALVLLGCLCVSCSNIEKTDRIAGYHILQIPASASIYTPGRFWKPRIGPVGKPQGEIISGSGPTTLMTSEESTLETGIKFTIGQLLSSSLGVSSKHISSIHLGDLKFTELSNFHTLGVSGTVLYGTLEANDVEINLLSRPDVNISLEAINETGIELVTKWNNEKTISIRSKDDSGLVVAVKIVTISMTAVSQGKGEMSAARVGDEVEIGLGYVAKLLSVPDASLITAEMRLRNSRKPGFVGETVRLSPDEPWLSPTHSGVSQYSDALIWDKIEMQWSGTIIDLSVTRFASRIELWESGI